jgi:hypothetical protein
MPRVGATANLDSSCARRRERSADRDEETGRSESNKETDEEKCGALPNLVDKESPIQGGRPFFGTCPPAREKRGRLRTSSPSLACARSKSLRGRRQTAPRLSAPSRTQGRDLRPDLLPTWEEVRRVDAPSARGSARQSAAVRAGASVLCNECKRLLIEGLGFSNSSPFVEPLSDRGGVIDD